MKEHFTNCKNYQVIETINGLDVYENDEFVCELYGKTFADYSYNGVINDDNLESDIDEMIDTVDFIENQLF